MRIHRQDIFLFGCVLFFIKISLSVPCVNEPSVEEACSYLHNGWLRRPFRKKNERESEGQMSANEQERLFLYMYIVDGKIYRLFCYHIKILFLNMKIFLAYIIICHLKANVLID